MTTTDAVVRAFEAAFEREARPLAERIADIGREAVRLDGHRRSRAP